MDKLENALSEKLGKEIIVEAGEEKTPLTNEDPDGIVTMEEARLACRIDGEANDDIIFPIKKAKEQYVLSAIDPKYRDDPRVKEAILTLILIQYRPERDAQGFLLKSVIASLLQMGKI